MARSPRPTRPCPCASCATAYRGNRIFLSLITRFSFFLPDALPISVSPFSSRTLWPRSVALMPPPLRSLHRSCRFVAACPCRPPSHRAILLLASVCAYKLASNTNKREREREGGGEGGRERERRKKTKNTRRGMDEQRGG